MKINFFVGYTVIVTMLLNINVTLIGLAITGISSTISFSAYADSDTQKLDEMKAKYGLSNPTRNHQSDTLDPNLEQYFNQQTRDLSSTIGNVLSTPVQTRTVDLSGYSQNRTMDEQLDMAKNLSKTHGSPVKDGDVYKSEYSKSGTRVFKRDENGKLIMGVVEDVQRVQDLNDNDMLGAETNNPNYSDESNKQSLYGDNQKIFDEGKAIHTAFKDANLGKTAAGRGYRAITRSAQRGIDTNIVETEPWLQPGLNAVKDSQDPATLFSACTEVKRPVIDSISLPTTTEHKCQDITKINQDFCEVTREVKVPVFSNTPGLRSCGVGCYEFDLNVDAWKTSHCRSTPADAAPATFTLNLNLSHGLIIKNVTIQGTADDHFLYTLNGQKLWESNGGYSQATSGNWQIDGCNPDGSHTINTNITSRVNAIVGPLGNVGVYSLAFRGDVRWKQNGGMSSIVRFEVEDTSGEGLETKFVQYPEGCYDALTMEDKLTKGLFGVYDWQELGIDPSVPPIRYECTSDPRQPLCPNGQLAFGSAGQERCYAQPATPMCDVGTYNSTSNRCEYPATVSCPAISGVSCGTDGNGQPIYPVTPSSSINGLMCQYSDATNCGPWLYQKDADLSCPAGGTLDGANCVMPVNTSNMCDTANGYSLKSLMINGVDSLRCEGPIANYSQNNWSCGVVNGQTQTFSSSYCAVTREDFLDENGVPIPTVDSNGNPINPPYFDIDGQPITFMDVAKCTKPQSLPNTELPELPQSFCTFDEYQNIEVGDRGFPDPILAAIPPFYNGDSGNRTWKVNLKNYRCDPTHGQLMCRLDETSGEQICKTWEELRNTPDQCAPYKTNPNCTVVSKSCVDGWLEPVSGRCLSETVNYECTTSTPIDYQTEITTNSCTGMLPCLGGDCEVTDPETNPNFIKAMVASSVIDEAQDDSKCEDPADPSSCKIFNGTFKYCSWESSGLGMDCCEEAKGVDIIGYVVFARQMLKVGKMAGSGAYGSGVNGMYNTLSEPITSASDAIASWSKTAINEVGSYVQGAYTSTMNSLMGSSEVVTATGETAASVASAGAGEGMTAAIEASLSALQQQVYAFVYNMLPESLANLIFTTTTATTGAQTTTTYTANGPLTNALGNMMAVYAAYQMIKLALTLLTACDDIEMDMGVKLAQRTCFKIGDSYCSKNYPVIGALGACMQNRQNYCCYSSILSRIVMKESYNQLGINPLPYGSKPTSGTQMDESCPGLTFEQFGQVNFEAPSMQNAMQEWVGLLLASEQISDTTSEQSLTGGASTSDPACPPIEKPVLECYTDAVSLEEVCAQARDGNGNLVYELVAQECIKTLEPGQIWNAYGRKTTSQRTLDNIGTAEERVQESKNFMRDAANGLDCSVYPRPDVCNFSFDPRAGGQ